MGRLAPTPSGQLHLGNALAFGAAWLSVRKVGGRLLLRVEDVDRARSRRELETNIRDDLHWLGIDWDEETPPQRERRYGPWTVLLAEHTYRCTCTRSQIVGAYSGTCRDLGHTAGALRFRLPQGAVRFVDRRYGIRVEDPNTFGDPVLVRRGGEATYNLAVVVDDLCDGVTEVVRGADLLDYTAVQIRLWEVFGATPPTYLHVPMLLGPDGTKLSKRHGATAIAALREQGWSPEDVWRRLLPYLGLPGVDRLEEAASAFVDGSGALDPQTIDDLPVDDGRPPGEP